MDETSMEEINISSHHQKASRNTSTPNSQILLSSTYHIMINPILPTEISIEILLHLPIKSLLKFTSISKSFLSLIKSPYFTKSHLSKSLSNPHYHLLYSPSILSYTLYQIPLSSNFLGSSAVPEEVSCPSSFSSLVGSVHGLICFKNNKNNLVLWNPCTQKFRELSDVEMTGFTVYGFGYDDLDDDYKVVAISSREIFECSNAFDDVVYEYDVSVFSRKKGSWKAIGMFKGRDPLIEQGIFVNGKVHWVNKCLEMKNGKCRWSIIAIDLRNGSINEVDQPCFGDVLKLGFWEERLCVICHNSKIKVDFWAMREYGVSDSWTKFCSIAYDSCEVYFLAWPLCRLNDEEIMMIWGMQFMLYNVNDGKRRFVGDEVYGGVVGFLMYVETLVSP